jgi:hypothetical protein
LMRAIGAFLPWDYCLRADEPSRIGRSFRLKMRIVLVWRG